MPEPTPDAFPQDEEPLRKAVLKGYFADAAGVDPPEPLVAHLRQLLSGPPGGETDAATYFFELDPEAGVPVFLRCLEVERPGLAALIALPILSAADARVAGRRSDVAPNPAVFISSLAGSIAVKADISEAIAGALLAGFLIAVGRLGPRRARALYDATMAGPPRRRV